MACKDELMPTRRDKIDITPKDPFYGSPSPFAGRAQQPGDVEKTASRRPLEGAPLNSRGDTLVLATPVRGTVTAPIVVESPKNGGEDAEILSVTLGLEYQGKPDGYNPQVRGTLTCNLRWGIGGASFAADLDWMQGQSFSLLASYVRVGATYLAAFNGEFAPLPPPLILSAGLGYGLVGQQFNTKRLTVAIPQLNYNDAYNVQGGTGGATLLVPRFATSLKVLHAPGLDLVLEFVTGTNVSQSTVLAAVRVNDVKSAAQIPIVIPAGSWAVRVYGLGPDQPFVPGVIVWNLEF